ncbi:MAG: endonuclease domain-containing protein [Leptolinea sp.]
MPAQNTTQVIIHKALELRHNMTEAEVKLWVRLRAHQMEDIHFRRQHAIGNYIVDFCAPRKKIIIEVDGSQHLEKRDYDAERTAFLESKGYKVIRFWNHEIMNDLDAVMLAIYHVLNLEEPPSRPSPIS